MKMLLLILVSFLICISCNTQSHAPKLEKGYYTGIFTPGKLTNTKQPAHHKNQCEWQQKKRKK